MAENTRLLEDNNRLLRKIHRNYLWSMWMTVLWYVLLIGLPFALYFYILQPYFEALGSSYETFSTGIQELPGWKQFNELIRDYQDANPE